MEVNKSWVFLLFFSLFLFSTLFGATQAHVSSLQVPSAINDSGKEINLATNFTQELSMRRALGQSSKNSNLKSVSKKDKKKKNAATTSRGNPSLALFFSTSLLGLAALLAC